MEVADYHSGDQRGSIRIPEGSRGHGWAKFVQEVCSFFLGQVAPPSQAQADVVPTKVSESSKGKFYCPESSRDPCVTKIAPPKIQNHGFL